MRYRPFGRSGAAVSALSLVLTDAPMRNDDRVKLIYAALEAGVNTFEIQSRDPAAAHALGEALAAIDRRMVFVAMRLGWSSARNGPRQRDLSPEALIGAVESMLAQTGLGRIDVAILDVLEGERLPAQTIPALCSARASGRVRMLGIGGGEGADEHIDTGQFDVLATPFNIHSGWAERNRLKRAGRADMAIIGCDYHPADLGGGEEKSAGPLGIARLLRRKERTPHRYEFLERWPGWTPEQICLGFALTEPSLATVQTTTRDPETLEALASVVERDLPTGLSAQIEMARLSSDQEKAALAKRRA